MLGGDLESAKPRIAQAQTANPNGFMAQIAQMMLTHSGGDTDKAMDIYQNALQTPFGDRRMTIMGMMGGV